MNQFMTPTEAADALVRQHGSVEAAIRSIQVPAGGLPLMGHWLQVLLVLLRRRTGKAYVR